MPVGLVRRNSPLIVTLPYTGVDMPRILVDRLEDQSRYFTAPDRFLARLLGGRAEQASILQANFHRFVSDVDYWPPHQKGPSKGMMGTVPILDTNGAGIWSDPPNMKEAAGWRAMYYAPYHAALAAQVALVRAQYGHAIILNLRARHATGDVTPASSPDRTTAPDQTPDERTGDLCVALGRGASCGADLSLRLVSLLKSYDDIAIDIDRNVQQGRITRHYGKPSACSHAIDMDVDERCYLSATEDFVLYDAHKSAAAARVLEDVIDFLDNWRPI